MSWLSICFIVSSATPVAISNEMPPKAKPPAPAPAPELDSVPMVTAIRIDGTSLTGFTSDYNLFHLLGGGQVGEWDDPTRQHPH